MDPYKRSYSAPSYRDRDRFENEDKKEQKSKNSQNIISTSRYSQNIHSSYYSQDRTGTQMNKEEKINVYKHEPKKLDYEESYQTNTKRKRDDEDGDYEESKIRRTTTDGNASSRQVEKKIKEIVRRDHQVYPQRNDVKPEFRKESNSTPSAKQHFLPMCGEIYLKNIESGIKKFEGRINGPQVQKMKVGDELKLFDNRAGWGIICKISSIDVFKSFESMLTTKGILSLLPQLAEESKKISSEKLLEKGVAIYKGFPLSNRVATMGVAAIGVTFINRVFNK